MSRRLIVNADDLGASVGVNRGIARAHERGVVTSASLMVRGVAAGPAAAYARAHLRLAVGLHVDLEEWSPHGEGEWRARYQVVDTRDAVAVEEEVARQLQTFHALLGRGPTHLDGHQHVQRSEPVRSVLSGHGAELGVPVRLISPSVTYCGGFYGQAGHGEPYPEGIRLESLLGLLRGLPEGVTELGCHPGYPDDLDSDYRVERLTELEVLCDDRVLETIAAERIELIGFDGLDADGGRRVHVGPPAATEGMAPG